MPTHPYGIAVVIRKATVYSDRMRATVGGLGEQYNGSKDHRGSRGLMRRRRLWLNRGRCIMITAGWAGGVALREAVRASTFVAHS